MRISTKLFTSFVAAALAVTFAQSPPADGGQGQGQGQGQHQGQRNGKRNGNGTGTSLLDMTQIRELSGTVTAVNMGTGMQYPSIEVEGELIRVAPVWYLLENDFEIAVNDMVTVQAVPSTSLTDPYLHAVWIRNDTSMAELTLRQEDGSAVWGRRKGRRGDREVQGDRQMVRGCGFSSIQTVSGEVVEVTLGTGIRQPNVILQAGDDVMSIKIGPSRVLLETEFEILPKDPLTVKYGVTTCTQEKVALELTKGDSTIKLRNEDGSRAW